jgi:hypothetical protein
MNDQLVHSQGSFGHLDPQQKRQYLTVLSEMVWDIESELARVKAERAALMYSLQADLGRRGE